MDDKENIQANDFHVDVSLQDVGDLDCVNVNSNGIQSNVSEIGQNIYGNVLMEINGGNKKRVPKRKRGDDTVVNEEDKDVQCILKKNKMTVVETKIVS